MDEILFNYDAGTATTDERSLILWISMLHSQMINCGAFDRLNDYCTQTGQELTILAQKADAMRAQMLPAAPRDIDGYVHGQPAHGLWDE